MNESAKRRDPHKHMLGFAANLLACFALVVALVPVQAVADDAGVSDPADLEAVSMPVPASNLAYTGSAQKLLAQNKGYTIEFVAGTGQKPEDIDVTTDKENVLATNAGTYNLKVTLNSGYKWDGGGTEEKVFPVTIDPADIRKAATMTVSDATLMDDPVEPVIVVKTADGTELKKGVDYSVELVGNDEVGTATAIIRGIGNYTGTNAQSFKVIDHVIMYRLYNPNSGEHFYTASPYEREQLIKAGWKNENIGWYAPQSSSAPVYRLYNPNAGEHHYTMSVAERDALVRDGWNNEGIGWYSDTNQTVKVLRQYNPNAYANNHNYTTSQYEFDHNIDLGWQNEGVGWYAVQSA